MIEIVPYVLTVKEGTEAYVRSARVRPGFFMTDPMHPRFSLLSGAMWSFWAPYWHRSRSLKHLCSETGFVIHADSKGLKDRYVESDMWRIFESMIDGLHVIHLIHYNAIYNLARHRFQPAIGNAFLRVLPYFMSHARLLLRHGDYVFSQRFENGAAASPIEELWIADESSVKTGFLLAGEWCPEVMHGNFSIDELRIAAQQLPLKRIEVDALTVPPAVAFDSYMTELEPHLKNLRWRPPE
ncbi:MAG: hypothetical protein HUU17_14140 [Chthonomonadales bacterium]|nr:hypothetical protein [Chthonomonadales bacterium]